MRLQKLIATFFSKSFEENINKEMLNYSYVFPYDEVKEYIDSVIHIPMRDFIDYVRSKVYLIITCKEIPQFSSLDDATSRFCQIISSNGDVGYKFDEVGKLLLDDGTERIIGAYRKYGENHSKTACDLGLAQNLYNTFYLSALGKVFNSLQEEYRTALLARTALRNPLFAKVFALSKNGDVNIAKLCQSLSTSTIKRRRSNVMKICHIILEQCKKEGFEIEHSISFIVD